jgi:hypothetical protein
MCVFSLFDSVKMPLEQVRSRKKRDKREGRYLPYFLRLISRSDDVSKSVSCTLGACVDVILSLDTGGMEIVAAVVTLDNFRQFNVHHLVYLPG